MKGWDAGKRASERARAAALSYAASGITHKHVLARLPTPFALFSFLWPPSAWKPSRWSQWPKGPGGSSAAGIAGIFLFSRFIFPSHCSYRNPQAVYCMYRATAGIYSFGCRWRVSERASERVWPEVLLWCCFFFV